MTSKGGILEYAAAECYGLEICNLEIKAAVPERGIIASEWTTLKRSSEPDRSKGMSGFCGPARRAKSCENGSLMFAKSSRHTPCAVSQKVCFFVVTAHGVCLLLWDGVE